MANAQIWCFFDLSEEEAHIKFGSVKPYLLVRLRGMSLTRPSNRMPKNPLVAYISSCFALLCWLVSLVASNAKLEVSIGPESATYPAT